MYPKVIVERSSTLGFFFGLNNSAVVARHSILLTKDLEFFTNKSLVRVGKKPAISYIVESYPKEIEMVITVGYFANQVQDFLTLAYPDRNFKFINVDKFDGEGTSLGYSMLKAKDDSNTNRNENYF